MAKAYWINTFRVISDPERLQRYIALAGPAMRAAGGRFLARGDPAAAFESGTLTRTTLIEFPSVAAAIAAYHSAPISKLWQCSAMELSVISESWKRLKGEVGAHITVFIK